MKNERSLYIDGIWTAASGLPFVSHNPATGSELWQGSQAQQPEIDAAIAAARRSLEAWSQTSIAQREEIVRRFASYLKDDSAAFAETISMEMGKPLWEAQAEVTTMINKVEISIEAYATRCADMIRQQGDVQTSTRHKPYGVLAVFGPFNFPGHLPNGHIVPALLAGNTIIFKPSELTPLVAEKTLHLWEKARLPKGVLNLLQGGRETGAALANHAGLDGVLFTGSWPTGRMLAELYAAQTGKILALEMGGNNPLVVWDVSDVRTAAYHILQSAYITSGQRCTCARRLIISNDSPGERLLQELIPMIGKIKVGAYNEVPEPFMGPLIMPQAVDRLFSAQEVLLKNGGRSLVPIERLNKGAAFVSPGLIDVTEISSPEDEELFGPLLQLIRVDTFDEAIVEANRTGYGLTAGLLSTSREQHEQFYRQVRAGVINWNCPTTGATSYAAFGGLGKSGNLRPSGYYSTDYCSYPVASTEIAELKMPAKLTPGIPI